MKLREGNPPVIGTCIYCGTNFASTYARKTHACKLQVQAKKGIVANDARS